VVADILAHLGERQAALDRGCMIVCTSRGIAVEVYDRIVTRIRTGTRTPTTKAPSRS
jgi:hypothetical protein